MAPDQEAEDGDGEARKTDEGVAERPLAAETGNDLADHAHAGQDHDVHGRVRIKPEQVLKQDRVAPQLGIENADLQQSLHRHQQQRDRQHGRAQHHDDARGIDRPDEQRQAEPGQPGGSHLVDRDDEVQPGEDRRKAGDEDPHGGGHHVGVAVRAAVGRVEGPAGVDAAGQQGIEREQSAEHVDVPAQAGSAWERPGRGRRSSAARESCPARRESTESGRKTP